jgi:hypothetical protein
MFKPLPADPVLIQKLRIRNRVASLMAFALLIFWPAINSYIGSTVRLGSLAPADLAVLSLFLGFGVTASLIPASVFFFAHALRYKKLLAHLGTNPAVFAATDPDPSDLSKLRSKLIKSIVWHLSIVAMPVILVAAASMTDMQDKMESLRFAVLGILFAIVSLTVGLAMSAASLNNYLTLKAQLRWAFPDAQAWSTASTPKTS